VSRDSLEDVNPKFETTVAVAGILCSLSVPTSTDETCSKRSSTAIQFLAMEHKKQ